MIDRIETEAEAAGRSIEETRAEMKADQEDQVGSVITNEEGSARTMSAEDEGGGRHAATISSAELKQLRDTVA